MSKTIHAILFLLISLHFVGQDTLIFKESSWHFLDDGTDQDTAWRTTGFNYSSWPIGQAQFGYGDGDESTILSYGGDANNKYITSYFRSSFIVPNPSIFVALQLEVMRDDGVVIYINGKEVKRDNMPPGPVDYLTYASSAIGGGDESTYYKYSIPASFLTSGINEIGVEIHQISPTSSDISFDCQLIGFTSANIIRGPYIQLTTPNSYILKWRTDAPTETSVYFGTSTAQLTNNAKKTPLVTEHEILISGLQPGTKYFYEIRHGIDVIQTASVDHYGYTHPQDDGPTRLWIIGDPGTKDNNQRAVRDAYYNYIDTNITDLFLMLGDNAYNSGTDAEYQLAMFENMYEDILRNTATWPCPGNHDYLSGASSANQTGPYYDIFSLPTLGQAGGVPSGTESYYSFNYRDIHLISLDSHDEDRNTTGAMLNWLRSDLQANTKKWTFVYWHHPPYTKGSHDSDNNGDSGGRMRDMRQNFLPLLDSFDIDMIFSGHSHSYERSYPLKGHYGTSSTILPEMILDNGGGTGNAECFYTKNSNSTTSQDGIIYFTAGSSGKISGGPLNHPAMYANLNQLGSIAVTVEGNVAKVGFINNSGNFTDTFRIYKGAGKSVSYHIHPGDSILLASTWSGKTDWSHTPSTNKEIWVKPTSDSIYIAELPENNCIADTFRVFVNPVGISVLSDKHFNLFPNPIYSGQTLNLKSQLSIEELILMNIRGHKVMHISEPINAGNFKIETPVLDAGIYFIQVHHQGQKITKKLIVLENN